ncbi:hypothetical protein F0562_019261 [Nyssa sinensis]|uniref:Glycosyltransferase n=1 Tax=Nyssa sinensis TaxID=561372 RepID=A0A5J4ZEL9_9ASTE|nr:hypothetical protein F0562_019261 [Nyssa sinensis]
MVKDIHVVMLPLSAFGHLIPFLQLSFALAKAGVHVSFVSTPKNIQRLPKLPPDVSALINLVALPMPAVDRNLLPEDAEATGDIPSEKIQYLMLAYDLLQHPFKQFIADQSPDWIVVDFSPHWAVEIVNKYLTGDNQKRIRSSPESLTSPPDWVTFPSLVAFRNYEAIRFHPVLFGENASGITVGQRLAKLLHASQAVAVRSCKEFEEEYLNLVPKIMGKPVIPVGLLPPEKPEEREFTDGSWIKIFKWLDEQKPKSIVFVGFGSECKLNKDQIYEIAYGLELSELPFLWALRKPGWAIDDPDALPLGFSHRTPGKGVVHIGWAPPVEILGHPSVGGSLFHSGWGSVIETLQYGHCLVLLPFINDQGLTARLLEEKGLATEVQRSEDGGFNRDGIAKSLRQAMISEEEQPRRDRVREVAGIFSDRKLHDKYIDGFVEYLKNGIAKEK